MREREGEGEGGRTREAAPPPPLRSVANGEGEKPTATAKEGRGASNFYPVRIERTIVYNKDNQCLCYPPTSHNANAPRYCGVAAIGGEIFSRSPTAHPIAIGGPRKSPDSYREIIMPRGAIAIAF